jgi:crotonobetainyl-CoA:carnitine CoA-transferase CaiB-like acyl-CoA transferase
MRHAGDLLQYHGGGLGSITPRFANNPEEPPLRLGYPISDFLTGLNAAVTALAAFAEASASGTPIVADVSGQQAIAFAMGLYSVFPAYEGRAVSRVSRPELAPYHFLPCRDGWVMVICPEQHQWQSLMELMGSPAWSQSELFDTSGGRAENWDAIEPFLVEWLQDRDAADIYVAAQARRIPLAPVSGPAALLESPQLQHRAFFERAAIGGREVRVPGVPFASEPVLAKAPESGESSFTIFDARMAGAQGARAPRP